MARTASRTAGGVAETVKTLVYAILIALVIRTFLFEPFSIPSASMVPTLLIGDYLFVSKFSYGYSRWSFPFGLPVIPGPGRILEFHKPQRGDVVVFKLPCDFSRLPPDEAEFRERSCDTSTDFIKRIVGLPGDRVQMKDGLLYINDQQVPRQRIADYYYDEPFRPGEAGCGSGDYTQYLETLPDSNPHRMIKNCNTPQFDNTTVFTVPPDHYFMMGDNRDDSADSRDPRSGVGFVPAENLVGKAQFLFFSTDGYAALWEPWKWPFTIRYGRLFSAIH
jgi:signal peptidase I